MARKLSQAEQDDIVEQMATAMDGDTERWHELNEKYYDRLDADHRIRVEDDVAEFADDAVGDPSWRL